MSKAFPLVIERAQGFNARCPDLFSAIVEEAAFVKGGALSPVTGQAPILTLALHA